MKALKPAAAAADSLFYGACPRHDNHGDPVARFRARAGRRPSEKS